MWIIELYVGWHFWLGVKWLCSNVWGWPVGCKDNIPGKKIVYLWVRARVFLTDFWKSWAEETLTNHIAQLPHFRDGETEAHSAWKALVEGCTVITLTMNFSFTWSLTVFIDALWWDLWLDFLKGQFSLLSGEIGKLTHLSYSKDSRHKVNSTN